MRYPDIKCFLIYFYIKCHAWGNGRRLGKIYLHIRKEINWVQIANIVFVVLLVHWNKEIPEQFTVMVYLSSSRTPYSKLTFHPSHPRHDISLVWAPAPSVKCFLGCPLCYCEKRLCGWQRPLHPPYWKRHTRWFNAALHWYISPSDPNAVEML